MTTTLKVVGWLECALQLLVCRAAAAAAAILGLPLRTFDKHVRPSLNARRIGRILVFEKGEINQWARDNRSKPGTDQTWEAWAAILSWDSWRTRRDSNPRLLPPEGMGRTHESEVMLLFPGQSESGEVPKGAVRRSKAQTNPARCRVHSDAEALALALRRAIRVV